MMGVGMRCRFVPQFAENARFTPTERREATVTAQISYINWEHKYFTAEYQSDCGVYHESFKFDDIGKKVTVGGREKNVHAKNH